MRVSRVTGAGVPLKLEACVGPVARTASRAWWLTMALTWLSACAVPTQVPEPGQSRLPSPDVESGLVDGVLSTEEVGLRKEGVVETELYPGTETVIDEAAASRRRPALPDDGEIVLNFEGESIQSVVHTILGEVLHETFVIGPGVSGQVTFSTSKPVSRDQLMPILELLLKWNGATLVWHEGRYHVLPVSEAIPGHLVPRMGPLDQVKGYEVRAVPLRYISPTEMAKILEPYARPDAIVNVDVMRSMLFLAGTREELANYLQTVEIFDVDWLSGMSVGIYPLQTVDVESITAELTAVFGMEAESPLAGLFRFVPLERLGSILVITPRPEYLDKAQEWIDRLDRGAAGGGTQLFVYRVKNLEAAVLAGYLTQLFGGSNQASGRERPNNLAPGLEPVTMGSVSSFNQNRETANTRGLQGQGGGNGNSVIQTEEGDIRITSILETNSLLIQATQSQYSSIRAAMERIDEEPLQVLIEAQVLDVALNDQLAFGVDWYLSNNPDVLPDGYVGNPYGRTIDTVETDSGGLVAKLSEFMFGDKTLVQATITALDTVTDVRSIAAPSLVVRNNAQATITVGDQVPVQSSSISTGNNNVISSAQYVSTGVTLTVTPRINPGGLVYMDISQEVSRPGARDPDISTSGNPPISNKSVTSQVAVQSGQTIFLGGLISEQDNRSSGGVPFLSRVPGIGGLFGTKSTAKSRSETLVMITPTVIVSSADLKVVTEDLRDEFIKIPPLKIHTLRSEDRQEAETDATP